MFRQLLESVELQRVRRIIPFQRDDGSKCVKLVFGELFVPCLVSGGERRLQLIETATTVTGTVFNRPDPWVASTPAAELLVCGAIFYQEVAEVSVTISQGSPPVVT
jgi:hypothetical protein